MAAPAEVYTNKKLPVKIAGVAKFDSYLALKLAEYGSNIKNLFHLDLLLIGADGFLGAVEDNPNNDKYRHHDPARFSKIVLKGPDGKKYRVLNDGGLNTRGDAYVSSSAIMYNGLHVTISGISAYYTSTIQFGLKWRVKSGATWTNVLADTSGEPQKMAFASTFILEDLIVPGNEIDLLPFCVNAEETYEPNSHTTITIGRPSTTFGTAGDWPSNAYADFSVTPGTFWLSTIGVQVGTKVYASAGGAQAGAGYYANGDMWFKTEIQDFECVVVAVGGVGVWPPGDPATPQQFIPITYGAKHADWQQGCIIMNGSPSPITVYYDTQAQVYRDANNGGAALLNGFYYSTERGENGAYPFVSYSNGIQIGTGDCNEGIHIS